MRHLFSLSQRRKRPQSAGGAGPFIGAKAAYGYADLIDTDETLRCISAGAEFLGGIDILVNNVGGIVGRKWLGEIDRAFWQTVIDVNMTTMLNVTQSALPFLKAANGASIVNPPRRPAEPAGTRLAGLFRHQGCGAHRRARWQRSWVNTASG